MVGFDFLIHVYFILQTRTQTATEDDRIMVSALHYFRATDDIDPKNAVRREAPP